LNQAVNQSNEEASENPIILKPIEQNNNQQEESKEGQEDPNASNEMLNPSLTNTGLNPAFKGTGLIGQHGMSR